MAVIRWSPPLISPPGRSDPQIARIDHHHLPPPWRLSPGAGLFQPGCESPDTGLFCQKDPTQAATNSSAPARMHVARRRSVPARMRIAGHRSVLPEGSYTSSYKFFRPGPDARHQAPVCSSPDAVAGHRSVPARMRLPGTGLFCQKNSAYAATAVSSRNLSFLLRVI